MVGGGFKLPPIFIYTHMKEDFTEYDFKPKAFVFENVPGLLNVNNGADFQNLWR